MRTLVEFLNAQIEWSKITFGDSGEYLGICGHIEKELDEVRNNPNDLMEWIDIVILALDGAWRAGFSANEIKEALFEKQQVNFNRVWGTNIDPSTPNEHTKS